MYEGPPGADMIPVTPKPPPRDAYEVVKMLERELASERFERREEVSFLTKMHEREAALLKRRATSAAQQVEQDRHLFDNERDVLASRLTAADQEVAQQAD